MRPVTLARKGIGADASLGDEWQYAAHILIDLLFISLNGIVVFYSRFAGAVMGKLLQGEQAEFPSALPWQEYLGFFFLYAIVIVMFLENQKHYHLLNTCSAAEESVGVARAVFFATLLIAAVIYLSGAKSISRLVVGFSGLLNISTLVLWRLWRRQVIERRVAQGEALKTVLIVGAGPVGQGLAEYFRNNRQLGVLVKGFLDSSPPPGVEVLGTVAELADVARANFVDEIFIAETGDRETVKRAAIEARRNHIGVLVIPDLYDGLGWGAPVEHVGDVPAISLHREPIPVVGLMVKRVMDVAVSAAALVLLSPVLAAIALAIKLDSPGGVLYRSQRVGKKGRTLWCYKFRTMGTDADARKEELREKNERQGPIFKMDNDPRVTRLGRWLRKYSLDELPQFWNVLKGEMSLVGPRPHTLDDYEQYSLDHLRRLDVTPGLTGLWQVRARREPMFEKAVALDVEYIENWSIWLDLKIILETIPSVFKGTGV